MKSNLSKAFLFCVVLIMALSMSFGVFAADVKVYTTADDLTFTNPSSGDSGVSAPKTNGGDGEYNVYTLSVEPGTYKYTSTKYGTGMLKIDANTTNIYLRAVDFTFASISDGGTAYTMKVTNVDDKYKGDNLVYTSNQVQKGEKTAKLLVPALGWGVDYQWEFVPDDKDFASFHAPLWVVPDTKELVALRNIGYNYSDSGKYQITKKATMTFSVPDGFDFNVYSLVRFYAPFVEFNVTKGQSSGGYTDYAVELPKDSGGHNRYVVSREGCTSYINTFKLQDSGKVTISKSDISKTDYQKQGERSDREAASIITNGNWSKFIPLKTGEDFAIWSSRAWQAVSDMTSNKYAEPDKHYTVIPIEGEDVIEVDDIGTVTAKNKGVAAVAITYDAMYYLDQFYPAIDSDCVGLFVFSVDGDSTDITTGLSEYSDFDTSYAWDSISIVGQDKQTEKDPAAKVTFTPKASGDVQVRVSTVSGYPTPKMSEWRGYTKAEDGSFTVDLKPGRNIVEVKSGDKAAYHVLNCKATGVTVENVSSPGKKIGLEDTVKVNYDNIDPPQVKLGAINNPGFPDTVYLMGKLVSPSGKSTDVEGKHTQNATRTSSYFEALKLTEKGEYQLNEVRIHSGAISTGGNSSGHLNFTRMGQDGIVVDGGDSPSTSGVYSYLPSITIEVADISFDQRAKEIMDLIDAIGDVKNDDATRKKIEAARSAYDNAGQETLSKISEDYVNKLKEAEKKYYSYGEKAVEDTISKQDDYYLLENVDQLEWFVGLVNGTLYSKDLTPQPDANAKLGKNIVVNENLLDDDYITTRNEGLREWTSISSFSGVFDGNNHSISGLYQLGEAKGMFATNEGTIRNLTVKDSDFYYNIAGTGWIRVGGIVQTNNGVIENVTFDGYVGSTRAAGDRVGGIAGSNTGTITQCTVKGKIIADKGHAGGISYETTSQITQCVNDAAVSGVKNAGGIVVSGSNGYVSSCYSTAASSVTSSEATAAGIAVNRIGFLGHCYSAATVTGSEDAKSFAITGTTPGKILGLSYYEEKEGSGKELADVAEAKAKTAFESGEVAFLLGDDFGQNLDNGKDKDTYPVIYNGENAVFEKAAKDGYTNTPEVETVQNLINAIGTVAIDGTADCFTNIGIAERNYNALSAEKQGQVNNKDVLDKAKEEYQRIVKDLIAEINDFDPAGGMDACTALQKKFEDYAARGGDLDLITNYGDLSSLPDKITGYNEEQIEKGIKTKNVDDKKYYVLTNKDEFFWFLDLVNGSLVSKDKTADQEANAMLGNDITFNDNLVNTLVDKESNTLKDDSSLVRHNAVTKNFMGTLDGNGKKLKGYYSKDNMFTYLSQGAEIKNLVFEDSVVSLSQNRGVIVGTCTNGSAITNCHFDGYIYKTETSGGLVGSIGDSGNSTPANVTISDCGVSGTIAAKSFFGGGLVATSSTGASESVIERCHVDADFVCLGTAKNISFAGLISTSYVTVKDCYVRGALKLTQGEHKNFGGIVQYNKGSVINCYTALTIEGGTLDTASSGHISARPDSGSVSNCYYLAGNDLKGIGGQEDAAGVTQSRAAEQFKDGTVTKELGAAFQQEGDYPELVSSEKEPEEETYTLTVVNGKDLTNQGPYKVGDEVKIQANDPEEGMRFSGWTADSADVRFGDETAKETFVVMPKSNVTVTANYKKKEIVDNYDGHVTVSFVDNGVRDEREENLYPDAFGIIVPPTEVGFYEGENAADVTVRLLDDKGIEYKNNGTTASGFYLTSIGNFTIGGKKIESLGEFDCGALSGWMITLNNKFIESSVSDIKVTEGDEIKWQYSCQLGKDIGQGNENPLEVNRSALSGAIANAESKQEADYTAESWASMQTALAKAREVLADEKATQEQVNEAAKALNDAITGLKEAEKVNLSDLNGAIANAESKKEADYTAKSWASMQTALAKAREVLADEKATQEQVNEAAKALNDAITGLKSAKMPFDDVPSDKWFYDGVQFAYENDITSGTAANHFAPNIPLTREQCVAILYRLVGSPKVDKGYPFTDITDKSSYAKDAIAWAYNVGLITGTSDTTFNPKGNITRQDLAAILYRFYVKPLANISAAKSGTDLKDFKDFKDYLDVEPYALDPMKWAVKNGYIQGVQDNRLAPKSTATRAQFVTILMRTSGDELQPQV